jgi:hypothetical protein
MEAGIIVRHALTLASFRDDSVNPRRLDYGGGRVTRSQHGYCGP